MIANLGEPSFEAEKMSFFNEKVSINGDYLNISLDRCIVVQMMPSQKLMEKHLNTFSALQLIEHLLLQLYKRNLLKAEEFLSLSPALVQPASRSELGKRNPLERNRNTLERKKERKGKQQTEKEYHIDKFKDKRKAGEKQKKSGKNHF